MKAKSYPLGGIALLDFVEKRFGLLSGIFGGVGGRAKDFPGRVKLLLYNRLTEAVSVHRIPEAYPGEVYEPLGLKRKPSERSLYRALEGVDKGFQFFSEISALTPGVWFAQ